MVKVEELDLNKEKSIFVEKKKKRAPSAVSYVEHVREESSWWTCTIVDFKVLLCHFPAIRFSIAPPIFIKKNLLWSKNYTTHRKKNKPRKRPPRWEKTLQHFRRTPGTDSSSETRVNVCPLLGEANLNTGFPIPFFDLWCWRHVTEHRALVWWMHLHHLHQRREIKVEQPILPSKSGHCLPIFRSSIELDWRTAIFVVVKQKGLLIESGKATKSWHLARVSKISQTDTEPAFQWSVTWILPKDCESCKRALLASSSSDLPNVPSLGLEFLLASDDPGPWGPSDWWAIAVSWYVPRSCRARFAGDRCCIRFQCGNTGCKSSNHFLIFVLFASYEETSIWKQFSNLDTLWISSGNFATCTNISLIFSPIVLAHYPVLSKSRRRTRCRRYRHIRSIARTCYEKRWTL